MAKKQSSKSSSNKGCAILSYLLIGIIWYFVDNKMKKDSFVKFHVKQGLGLLILDIIVCIIAGIPILGWIIAPILNIIVLVLLIVGIINAANNKEKELPIIGKYASDWFKSI